MLSSLFHSSRQIRRLRFMRLFGHRGGTHPTRAQRSPGLTGSAKQEQAPAAWESAGQALDGVEPG
jgi:hypothetical protein